MSDGVRRTQRVSLRAPKEWREQGWKSVADLAALQQGDQLTEARDVLDREPNFERRDSVEEKKRREKHPSGQSAPHLLTTE